MTGTARTVSIGDLEAAAAGDPSTPPIADSNVTSVNQTKPFLVELGTRRSDAICFSAGI